MPDFDEIALRQTKQGSERGLVTGGSGSGKSTLSEFMITDFVNKYKNGRVVIADSKPRFRGEYEITGITTKRSGRYKRWDHGTYIPNSVVADLSRRDCGLEQAWTLNQSRIVILQTSKTSELGAIMRGLNVFYEQARASRPQLMVIDEMADFFGVNGQPVPGLPVDYRDVILRTARAGRELGLGLLASMQRPVGVPKAVVQELNKLYLFRLDNVDDMRTLWDLGIPTDIEPPLYDHEFIYWQRRSNKPARLLTLNLSSGDETETVDTAAEG